MPPPDGVVPFLEDWFTVFAWVINNVYICWGYGPNLTVNCNITFPITFKNNPTLLGVGFVIEGISQQRIGTITTSTFNTGSNVRTCGTNSYVAIGY